MTQEVKKRTIPVVPAFNEFNAIRGRLAEAVKDWLVRIGRDRVSVTEMHAFLWSDSDHRRLFTYLCCRHPECTRDHELTPSQLSDEIHEIALYVTAIRTHEDSTQ